MESDAVSFYERRLILLLFSVKIVVFSIAFICSAFIEPYNSGVLIMTDPDDETSQSLFEEWVRFFLRPFFSWDGAYFLSIAKHGYIYEQQNAFFPLFPQLVRTFADAFLIFLKPWIGLTGRCMLASVFLGNLFHCLAILSLFQLSLVIFQVPHFAFLSSAFACLIPAQGILASSYSESLFMFLTITGLNFFYQKRRIMAALTWSLASMTRSNGILLPGFFIYEYIHGARHMTVRKAFIRLVRTVLLISVSWIGMIKFLASGYTSYCLDPKNERPWCHNRLPNIYSFVQSHYWNVGFLRYFTLSQIPNFLLAMPMIVLSLMAIISYCSSSWRWSLTLGLSERNILSAAKRLPYMNRALLPHVYLLAFMLVYTVFVVHVQIINRIFTFMPIIYWYQAHIYSTYRGNKRRKQMTHVFLLTTAVIIFSFLFFAYYPPA